ncbi:VOC family protein [Clostridium sp. MSJ-11]|uniref:VOC family protein n=1 Tax=Clostridium mobile TaxID=2841512 RepID=A0ABS6EGQ6_9CLOT|nr:VOC family protein [Clostridium mobile]MBU5484396.1 VOC family protein [Clostridium mobile]
MKFCWSTLTVKDMEESLKFYTGIVGLPIVQRFQAGPGMEIAFLGDGETKVELIHDKEVKEVNMGADVSLGFEVESLDKMAVLLEENGIKIEAGPFQPNPSTRFFFVLDPNGLTIQFIESK